MTDRTFASARHETRYREIGQAEGPLIIFLHGWPGSGLVWRAQMDALSADGWRCIAPDMRGYGGSSAPDDPAAFAIEEIVLDMVELHDALGGEPAVWIGHDLGSPVAAALASHHPRRCRGLALISVPYFPNGFALANLLPLVDRELYPADEYPEGQWDYCRFYTNHFEQTVSDFEADIAATLAAIFQPGVPASRGKPYRLAMVSRNGGWFGAAHRAPVTEPNPALWPPGDFALLVADFEAKGFRPANAWYLNDDANVAYAADAIDGGWLAMPVLFVNGRLDGLCDVEMSRIGDPMREACANLSVGSLEAAHWLPLERKDELSDVVRRWLEDGGLREWRPPTSLLPAAIEETADSGKRSTANTSSPFSSWTADHSSIRVPDFEEAVRWYVEKLDFRLLRSTTLRGMTFGFVAPPADDSFALEIIGGPGAQAKPGYEELGESYNVGGWHHIGIRVDDVDSTVAELKRRGVKIVSEPHDVDAMNLRLAFLSDPWGNLLEVIMDKKP